MWPLATSWPTKLLVTFAPWSKHGVGGYGHASLIIIDHHWSSIVEIQAELIYSIIQYILMNPLNDHPYLVWLYDFQGKSTLWVSEPSPPTPGNLTPGFLSVENLPRGRYDPQDQNIREHSPTWSNMQSAFHQGSLVNWYFMCDFAKWIEMQMQKKRFLPPSDISQSIPGHSQRFLRTSVFRN